MLIPLTTAVNTHYKTCWLHGEGGYNISIPISPRRATIFNKIFFEYTIN